MNSTQEEQGIPVSISASQQNLRLLELPPPLLELLTSANPPTLYIKSARNSSTTLSSPGSSSAYAVLCTPTQTFQLRQVHTSNSVFITQADEAPNHGEHRTSGGISAVASCGDTLELHTLDASATPYILEALPLYERSNSSFQDPAAKSKSQVFADVPFSDEECELVWTQLVAFEIEGRSYRPSAQTLIQAWQDIVSAATVEGLSLDSTFRFQILQESLEVSQDDSLPIQLYSAVMRRLAIQTCSTTGEISIDKAACIHWVGQLLLECQQQERTHASNAQFLEKWKDHLPEGWRDSVDINLFLNALATQPSQGLIDTLAHKNAANSNSVKGTSKVRKWHEKFKRT